MISMVGKAAVQGATAAAQKAGLPGRLLGGGAVELTPCYGLNFRFSVLIEGLSIEDWSSCTGLRVDFKTDAVPRNGNAAPLRLPKGPEYKNIVLKRALDRSSSAKLQEWLRERAWNWFDGKSDLPSHANIVLFGPDGEAVAGWEALNVRPVAWSGPELEATSAKVAYETLELAHDGIVMVAGDGRKTPASDHLGPKSKLTLSMGGAQQINFRADPTTLTVRVNQGSTSMSTSSSEGGGTVSTEATEAGVIEYSLKDLYLEAPRGTGAESLTAIVERLLNWGPKSKGKKAAVQQPVTLNCGELFKNRSVCITKVEASYVRFAFDATPQLAKISNLAFQDYVWVKGQKKQGPQGPPQNRIGASRAAVPPATPPSPAPPSPASGASPSTGAATGSGMGNPTSGGIPGRSAHTVVLGDDLTTLAREAYGSPARWRDLAEANGIDDPRRLQPGRTLYLPAHSELDRRG